VPAGVTRSISKTQVVLHERSNRGGIVRLQKKRYGEATTIKEVRSANSSAAQPMFYTSTKEKRTYHDP